MTQPSSDAPHGSLAGRVFLVLGGSGDVGSAVVLRLLARGARVRAVGRHIERLSALEARGAMVHRIEDATRPGTIDTCFETTAAAFGAIDGVVNCIGSILLKPAQSTQDAEFDSVIATNLGTAFATVRSAARFMRERGGSVVLISSAAARIGLANHEAIAAAKAGIEGLARAAAATYAPTQMRFNVVAPGLVQTKLTSRITQNEASLKTSVAMHALGRIGQPDEVASAIEWFLDPAQSWVTGQVLGIDGGLGSLRRPG